jgi:uncharacterized RDD family membrane protein YckC
MKRVACPHCGFQNFEISAYCGRCERPLPLPKKDRPVEPAAEEPDAGRLSAPRIPPPTPPREDVSPMPIESSELLRAQEEAVSHKAAVRAATENLPEAAEAEPELDAIEAIEATGSLDLEEGHPGAIEVPVRVAAGWQVALGRGIDGCLVAGAGILVMWLETVLLPTPWHSRNVFAIDLFADWLHAHSGAVSHGVIVTLVAGVAYQLWAGRRSGRTLGRFLTGTVLVRASGRALTWHFLAVRTLLSLISLGLLGVGYFWGIIDRQHRTWHDILLGTVVVRRRVRLSATPP